MLLKNAKILDESFDFFDGKKIPLPSYHKMTKTYRKRPVAWNGLSKFKWRDWVRICLILKWKIGVNPSFTDKSTTFRILSLSLLHEDASEIKNITCVRGYATLQKDCIYGAGNIGVETLMHT